MANDVQLGGTLGKYSYKTLQLRTVAVIDDRTAYGSGVAKEFQKVFKLLEEKLLQTNLRTTKLQIFLHINIYKK